MAAKDSGSHEPEQTADKLKTILEALRVGHAALDRAQFMECLQSGEFECWQLPCDQYALVTWGAHKEGLALNILTTVGSMEHAAEGLAAIEKGAKARGASIVISVGKYGWKNLVEQAGYTVEKCILMKKVIT